VIRANLFETPTSAVGMEKGKSGDTIGIQANAGTAISTVRVFSKPSNGRRTVWQSRSSDARKSITRCLQGCLAMLDLWQLADLAR
jgi:hypothetical protein